MTRNTVRRVEVAAPILDPDIKDEIRSMFNLCLSDNVKAREQSADGIYRYVTHTEPPVNAQEKLYEQAYEMAGASMQD